MECALFSLEKGSLDILISTFSFAVSDVTKLWPVTSHLEPSPKVRKTLPLEVIFLLNSGVKKFCPWSFESSASL